MKYYYDQVTGEFDKVLAEHGYVRDGHYYRVEKANNGTLVFFCHFRAGLCAYKSPAQYVADGTLAQSVRSSEFCYYSDK